MVYFHATERESCPHRWELFAAEAMSADRLHLSYKCEWCGVKARQAWGITKQPGDGSPPTLFEKNLPIYEQHFLVHPKSVTDTTICRLDSHPFLDHLRGAGYIWEGAPPTQAVLIVATQSGSEWAAYYQTPTLPVNDAVVADHGDKLPEHVAKYFFRGITQTYRH